MAAPEPEPAPRFTSDAVRKLFRDVARTIHPDLAGDEHTRDRRHALMIEANRAYAHARRGTAAADPRVVGAQPRSRPGQRSRGDAAAPRAPPRADRGAPGHRAPAISAALQASRLYELKAMVDEAAASGRDLVADMVRRLKRDIMAATNRLDAMRSTP